MNEIQGIILEVYKTVCDLCKRHEIPFYAIGGTCIGAVRHKGFIPWDDDLDIAIPIQHYDRFWEIAERELPEHLKVYSCKNIRNYRYIFGKVHNYNTTFIEKSEVGYHDAYKGIFIDIMPISSIPDDNVKREKFYSNLIRFYKLNYIRRYPFSGMDSLKKKILWLLMRPVSLIVPPDYYSEKWLNMLRENPLGSSSLTGYTWSTQVRKLTFPMKDFEKTIEVPFEDTIIYCPVDYNDYLTIQFGDYMKLPPEDQRAPHHTETIDCNKSYINYYKGESK